MYCKKSLEQSKKTAIGRASPSFLAKTVLKLLSDEDRIFDWGCGRGHDIEFYKQAGYYADGCDPNFKKNPKPAEVKGEFNIVTCGCVLNILRKPARKTCLRAIKEFLPENGKAYFSVRTKRDIGGQNKLWKKEGDGWITSRNTFQHGFTPNEIEKLLKLHFSNVKILKKQPAIVISVS